MLLQAFVLVLLNCHNIVASASPSIINFLPGFPADLPFKLETGYVGVGYRDDVQLFYYFIESEGNPEYDPLVLWLAGGPGCSAFTTVAYQIGPISFDCAQSIDKPKLKLSPYSWTKVANMLFVDAPVGTGFSYRKTWEGLSNMTDTLSATHTYQFLRKWLVDHPKFLKNPLYVAGDSYAGIPIPMVVQKISDGIETGILEPPMNLKGYILGNPVTETDLTRDRVIFHHRTALISDELYQSIQTNCKGENYDNVNPNNTLCVDDLEAYKDSVVDINVSHILDASCRNLPPPKPMGSMCVPNDLSNKDSVNLLLSLPQNPRPWCREDLYAYSTTYLNDKTVQNALRVQEGTIKDWERCNTSLKASYIYDVSSTVAYHDNLIKKGYRVLIYSGDHDSIVPYVNTIGWIRSLNLTVASHWKHWFVNGQVAGYRVKYTDDDEKYQLTFATVKGAGHIVAEYKPEEVFTLISRWFSNYPL